MTSPVRNRKPALVVFLDILGFGRKVVNIQTDKDADGIYKILSFIHDEFESKIDDKTAEGHGLQGKEVLAFSDSVVISLYFDSIDTRGMGLFDNMLAHLHYITLCHLNCLAEGIFLRGGVAKGEWFRQGDIIISDALVKAYLMESRKAKYPILAIDPDTYKYLASLPGRRNYSPDTDPIKGLFKSTKNGQDTAYYLDYLNIGFACSDDWYCEKDRKKYLAAKTDERKNEIFCKSHKKNQLAFLKAHQRTIIDALKKSTDKRAKSKYRWLCRYHNSIVREKGPDFKSALIDSAIILSSKI